VTKTVETLVAGGEREIRTLDGVLPPYSLSRRERLFPHFQYSPEESLQSNILPKNNATVITTKSCNFRGNSTQSSTHGIIQSEFGNKFKNNFEMNHFEFRFFVLLCAF
jgi:hypothetical protein